CRFAARRPQDRPGAVRERSSPVPRPFSVGSAVHGRMIELRTLGQIELVAPDGRRLQSVLAQPERLALLAYLALPTPRGAHRRDTLVALFWPELDQTRRRTAPREAVPYLRPSLEI